MGFENTQYAREFFQGQVPTMLKELKRIADNQEKQIELQYKALQANTQEQIVFVCREENSATLYPDAGNINQLFVTASRKEALDWAQRSVENARKNDFHPFSEEDLTSFYANFDQFKGSSVWVYKNRDGDSKENYGIVVNVIDLTQSSQYLRHLFE